MADGDHPLSLGVSGQAPIFGGYSGNSALFLAALRRYHDVLIWLPDLDASESTRGAGGTAQRTVTSLDAIRAGVVIHVHEAPRLSKGNHSRNDMSVT